MSACLPGNEYFGADVVNFVFRTQCGKQANCNANTLLCVYASLDRHINLDWWVSALVSIDSGCYMRGGMQCNNRQTKKEGTLKALPLAGSAIWRYILYPIPMSMHSLFQVHMQIEKSQNWMY